MKKYILVIIITLLIIPTNVLAKSNLKIECNKTKLHNNEETTCQIMANNLEYIATSISAKVTTTENIEIISSEYDEKQWIMFDKTFSVKDINLISEQVEKKEPLPIVKFKVKAINNKNTTDKITIKDIIIGDENYEEHEELDSNITLKLSYDKKYDEQSNKNIIIIITSLIIIIVSIIYFKLKEKEGKR